MPNLRQISFSNVRIAKRTGYIGGIRLQMRKMPVLITGRLVRFSVRVHLSSPQGIWACAMFGMVNLTSTALFLSVNCISQLHFGCMMCDHEISAMQVSRFAKFHRLLSRLFEFNPDISIKSTVAV